MNQFAKYNFDADIDSSLYFKEDPILASESEFHDSIEFIFIKCGIAKCFLEDKSQTLSKGDIFFVESYQTHRYEVLSDDFSATVLVLSREYTQTFRNLYPLTTFNTFLLDKEKNKEAFAIIDKWKKLDIGLQINNFAGANELFSFLVRTYPMIERTIREDEILEKKLLRYVHLHYLEDIKVTDIAKEVGYTPEYCSKILKRCLKGGVRNYINSLRLKKAYELLNDKSLNLSQSEVLFQCGFASPSTYYRVKKQFEKKEGSKK